MVCPLNPLLVKGNTKAQRDIVTPVFAQLWAPRIPSRGLVSLYHTLLITAMTGPLSQRMPSSFSGALGHVFAESCLRMSVSIWAESWLELFRLAPVLLRGKRRKVCISSLWDKKSLFFRFSFLMSNKHPGWYLHPSLFLCFSCSLASGSTLSHSCLLF